MMTLSNLALPSVSSLFPSTAMTASIHCFRMLGLVSCLAFASASFSVYANPSTVNVNTASAAELAEMLSGIGEKKAQAIVDFRDENGFFVGLEDLSAVKGIGESLLERNYERIRFE